MTQLHEVIYVSRRAPWVTDQIIVDEIVLPAGMKNRRLDITGCLWFSNDRFLQIIEGPKTPVGQVFEAIQNDDRHQDIVTISSAPLAARSFSRWGMRALTGRGRCGIDEFIEHYAPHDTGRRPEIHVRSSEATLAQVRSYLVQMAQVDSTVEA